MRRLGILDNTIMTELASFDRLPSACQHPQQISRKTDITAHMFFLPHELFGTRKRQSC